MKYAIKVLEDKIKEVNKPLEENEEECLYSAVSDMRNTVELKMALRVLNEFVELQEEFNKISWN